MNSNTKLKKSKTANVEREIKVTDLFQREKTIFVFPARVDTSYIVLRPPKSNNSKPISKAYPKLEEYLTQSGFKKKANPNSDRWITPYGLTIYYGKLSPRDKDTDKNLKIQLTGTYLIYKNAELLARRIVKDIRALLAKEGVLTDFSFSRLDPSYLVMCSSIWDIIPKPEENILLGNSLQAWPAYYKGSNEVSGMTYSNSRTEFKVYDKSAEITDKLKEHSSDYIEYYSSYIREAKKRKLKLFRLELKISDRSILFDYEQKFFSKTWDEKVNQESLKDIFHRFFCYHKYRKIPDGQKDKMDFSNRSHWDIDPMTKALFEKNTKKIELKGKKERKFKYELHKPKRMLTLEMAVQKFARDLAKINKDLGVDDLKLINDKVISKYQNEKYNYTISILDLIKRQTAYRLHFAENAKQIRLIKKEKKKLLDDLKIRESYFDMVDFKDEAKLARKRIRDEKKDLSDGDETS